jgi:predicted phosphodiesterase
MRYLILSDLHANLEATDAVLAAASTLSIDQTLVLGDLVGYGPNPNEVVERVRGLSPAGVIRGNHDRVAAGLDSDTDFNSHAQAAIRWTTAALSPVSRMYLSALPAGPLAIDADVELCHGAPFDEDFYVFTPADAGRALSTQQRRVCLFGHTHIAVAYVQRDEGASPTGPYGPSPFTVALNKTARSLINCGSVGQPRDGDWRAAFGVLDTDANTCTMHRVEYDANSTRRAMRKAGLPDVLIRRIGPHSG